MQRTDVLEQVGRTISALPLAAEFQNIGLYHLAYCDIRKGNLDEARAKLAHVADNILPEFRPRAILELGSSYFNAGQSDAAVPLYVEAARASRGYDPLVRGQALYALSAARGTRGDHQTAVNELEQLLPVMRWLGTYYPAAYFNYLNSLAVELGEVGRTDEANRAIDIALASPCAPYYPLWLVTKQEIASQQRRVFTPFSIALGHPAAQEKLAASAQPATTIEASPLAEVAPVAQANRKPETLRARARARKVLSPNPRSFASKEAAARIVSPPRIADRFTAALGLRGWYESPRARAPPLAHR